MLLCLYCIQVGSAKRVPLFLVRAIALAPPRHLILAPPRHILGQKTHHQKILPLSRIFQKIISHNYFTQCTSLLSPISSRETGDGRHKTWVMRRETGDERQETRDTFMFTFQSKSWILVWWKTAILVYVCSCQERQLLRYYYNCLNYLVSVLSHDICLFSLIKPRLQRSVSAPMTVPYGDTADYRRVTPVSGL